MYRNNYLAVPYRILNIVWMWIENQDGHHCSTNLKFDAMDPITYSSLKSLNHLKTNLTGMFLGCPFARYMIL